jgi:hypothetical protein
MILLQAKCDHKFVANGPGIQVNGEQQVEQPHGADQPLGWLICTEQMANGLSLWLTCASPSMRRSYRRIKFGAEVFHLLKCFSFKTVSKTK